MLSSRPRRSTRRTRLARAFTAASLAMAAIGGGAVGAGIPAAEAAPNGSIVTFGDSYTSNPDELRNAVRKVPIPQVQDFVYGNGQPSRHGCLQSQDNWPRQLGRITGAPIDDFSCTADSSHTIPTRVNWAIGSGAIHRGTRAVVISVGINDFGPYGVARGADPLNPGKVRNDYVNNIRTAVNKARAAAPGAKIIVAGTLSISDPGPLNTLCFLNVVPNAPAGIPMPPLQQVENLARDNQRAAAAATGATYVEIKDPSRSHSTCAPDRQRWVAGVVDPGAPHHMSLHPTSGGSRFMAETISRHV